MFYGRLARYVLAYGLRTVSVKVSLAHRAPRCTVGFVDQTLKVQLILIDERKETIIQIATTSLATVLRLAQTRGHVLLVGAHQVGRCRLGWYTHAIIFTALGKFGHNFCYVVRFKECLIHNRVAWVGILAMRAKEPSDAVAKVLDQCWIGLKRTERVKYGHSIDTVV